VAVVDPTVSAPRKGDDALDASLAEHIVGYLLAMAAVQTGRVYEEQIGTPFELRRVEFTLLLLLRIPARRRSRWRARCACRRPTSPC
jgi:hypothetical protein